MIGIFTSTRIENLLTGVFTVTGTTADFGTDAGSSVNQSQADASSGTVVDSDASFDSGDMIAAGDFAAM